MSMLTRSLTRRRLLAGVGVAIAFPHVLRAQTQDMSIIVGYPPGGFLDAMARMIAQHLAPRRGHAVIVDNKPGFSGNIGAQYVAKAKPDGNILLIAGLSTHSIQAILMGNDTVGYDLLKSFDQVAIAGYLPNMMIVPASLGIDTLPQFVAEAQTRPGGFSYATTGIGSLEHIAGEMFKRATGLTMEPVPYKGSAPAMTDVIGGRVQAMFVNAPVAISNLAGGRIKVIGIAGPTRLPPKELADVPTFREQGVVMRADVVAIYGLVAPAGTPHDVIERLNLDINAVLNQADVRGRFESLGVQVAPQSAAYATHRIRDEVAIWNTVLKETGITLEN